MKTRLLFFPIAFGMFLFLFNEVSAQGFWAHKNDFAGSIRYCAVAFSIGSKGYLGTGTDINRTNFYNDFWEYDTISDTWTQKANFVGLGRANAVGFSIGSKGYIATGTYWDSISHHYPYLNDLWEYDTAANAWTQKANLPNARAYAVGFTIGNKGYIGTGDSLGAYTKDFWEWDQSTNIWAQKADFIGVARYSAIGFGIGTKGYIGTGNSASGRLNDLYEYDQLTNTWNQKANIPGSWAQTGRYNAFGLSIGTKGYIGAGNGLQHTFIDFWEWDQLTNAWSQKQDYQGAAQSGICDFVIGNKAYVMTGQDSGISHITHKDVWEFDPTICEKFLFWGYSNNYNVPSTITFNNPNPTIAGNCQWKINGVPFSTNPDTVSYTFDTVGSFVITLIGAYGTCVDSTSQVINILCTIYGDSIYVSTTHISVGDSLYFQNSNYAFNYLYQWKINGNVFATTQNTGYRFNFPGIYTISSIESNAYCSDSTGQIITVAAHPVWTPKASTPGSGRDHAVGFSIGSDNGYVGTGYNGNFLLNFWEYSQYFNSWSQKASLPSTSRQSAIGFSIGTKGYIGTGSDSAGFFPLNDLWEWDKATNTWSQKNNIPSSRCNAVGFSIGNKGYVGTGYNAPNELSDFWQYDPATDTWTQKADFAGGQRQYAVGLSINGKGYIGLGQNGVNLINDFWEYDTTFNSWSQKANFPGSLREFLTGFSIGTKGYVGSGYDAVSMVYKKDFWSWDQNTNTWSQIPDFLGNARLGATAFSIGTKGYVGTGNDGNNFLSDWWEYDGSALITSNNNVSVNENPFLIYPNPLIPSSILQLNTELKNAEVVIYDMVGKEIMRKKLTGDRMEIEKGMLESGVYFVKVISEERQWVEKMVVE